MAHHLKVSKNLTFADAPEPAMPGGGDLPISYVTKARWAKFRAQAKKYMRDLLTR